MRLALVMAVLAIMFGASSIAQAQSNFACGNVCDASKLRCEDICGQRDCDRRKSACVKDWISFNKASGSLCRRCESRR